MDHGPPRMASVKTCSKCREEKSLSAFGRDRSKPDGLLPQCKGCTNARNRAWNRANPEKVAACQAAWLAKNPERAKEHQANYWSKLSIDRKIEKRIRRHGLTLERFRELEAQQEGLCPICKNPLDASAAVDHDHSHCPGQFGCAVCVRGLLHRGCNVMLGIVNEDIATLRRAIEYLGGRNERTTP